MRPHFIVYSGGRYLWPVLAAFLAGAVLLAAAAVWGLAQVAERLVPMAGQLAVIGLGVFVAAVIPLSLVREWRPGIAGWARVIARGYELGVWMVSFLTLWKWSAFLALPALLIPFLAAPAAVLRLVFLSDLNQAAGIVLAAVAAQGMRAYAGWLEPRPFDRRGFRQARSSANEDVIDTEIVEPRRELS